MNVTSLKNRIMSMRNIFARTFMENPVTMNKKTSESRPELLVLRALMPDQMQQLEQRFVLHRHDRAEDAGALIASVGSRIRGVVTNGGSGFQAAMLPLLPALEIVASSGVGTDSIDISACRQRGVHVTNTPDVLNDDVADLGIGLIMNAMRRLAAAHEYTRRGDWARKGMMPLTTSLRGKRLGIVGLGRIGRELANRAIALKMEVSYHGRRRQDVPYVFHDRLADLAANVDILVLLCPGGPETRHLVDQAVLDALGPDGWLVNLSRGSVVDEAALLDALESGGIAGAALDVYENEPHIDTRFLGLDNVILSPHHASATTQTRSAMAQLVVDNLLAHFQGRPLLTPVGQ